MRFESIVERVDSYIAFEFTKHDRDMICIGDQVWSDGKRVEVYDFVDEGIIEDLISQVENKQAFKGALKRVGVIK